MNAESSENYIGIRSEVVREEVDTVLQSRRHVFQDFDYFQIFFIFSTILALNTI